MDNFSEQREHNDGRLEDRNIVKDETNIVKDETNVVQEDTNIVENETNIVQNGTNMVEDDTDMEENDTANIAEMDTNIAEANTSTADEDTNRAAENTNIVEEDRAAADTGVGEEDTNTANNSTDTANIGKGKAKKGEDRALCKNCKQIVLNVHDYFSQQTNCNSSQETVKATKVSRKTLWRIRKGGASKPKSRKNNRIVFSKVDTVTKELIRLTVDEFYMRQITPSPKMVFNEIKTKTAGTDYEFPYGLTTFRKILKSIGFCNNSKSVNKSNANSVALNTDMFQ